MGKPVARLGDPVSHPLPPVLTGGPGSPTVLIGGLPAWRGIPASSVAPIMTAKQAADTTIGIAEANTKANIGQPSFPGAKAAEEATKTACAAQNAALITPIAAAAGADLHNCATPLPLPPHGPGVVTDGSPTVLINGAPAARQGDTIQEAVGPPNKIMGGSPTVLVGP